MGKVANDNASVVGCITLQANTVSAYAVGVEDSPVIDADENLVANGFIDTLGLGLGLRHIVDKPRGWVADLGQQSAA